MHNSSRKPKAADVVLLLLYGHKDTYFLLYQTKHQVRYCCVPFLVAVRISDDETVQPERVEEDPRHNRERDQEIYRASQHDPVSRLAAEAAGDRHLRCCAADVDTSINQASWTTSSIKRRQSILYDTAVLMCNSKTLGHQRTQTPHKHAHLIKGTTDTMLCSRGDHSSVIDH